MKPRTVFTTKVSGMNISLLQQGVDSFTVVYHQQVESRLNYAQAALELGADIMHALACDGVLDNRTKQESRRK